MFGTRNLGLHVLKCPNGRYSYVGSIPTELCKEVPATKAAVLGCRVHRGENDELLEWKIPVFDTELEAYNFAKDRGFEARVYGD